MAKQFWEHDACRQCEPLESAYQKQSQQMKEVQAELATLREENERLKRQKIMRQSQVYHVMPLIDRLNGESTADSTFFADVDRVIKRANRLGPPTQAAEAEEDEQ